MNVFTINMNNKPLRVTLLFSVFLHAIVFYFLSSLSFNSTLSSPEVVPITVRALTERKGIQAMTVKHVTQQNPRQSAHSPQLVSAELKENFTSQPTLIYKKQNRVQPSQRTLQAKLPKDIGQTKLASNNKHPSSQIESQDLFREELAMPTPKITKENKSSRNSTNFSVTSTKHIEVSQKETLSKNLQAHIISGFQMDGTQDFKPTPLYQGSEKNRGGSFIPDVRNISLTHDFTEESLEKPQATALKTTTPPSENFSSLDIGELRRGFHRKIWLKVTEAKYYPRMARKRGYEGKPIVTFTLGTKGQLLNLKLIEVSNYSLLNEAALETIRRGIPYPPIPEPLGKDSISFNLPILYMLEE